MDGPLNAPPLWTHKELIIKYRPKNNFVQLSKSSLIKQGGAYFSAISGWKSILMSALEAYGHRECCRVPFISLTLTFVLSFRSLPCSRQLFNRICSKTAKMCIYWTNPGESFWNFLTVFDNLTIMTILTFFTIFSILANFDNFRQRPIQRQSQRLVTFETLTTILTIENLNSWQSLLPDN